MYYIKFQNNLSLSIKIIVNGALTAIWLIIVEPKVFVSIINFAAVIRI